MSPQDEDNSGFFSRWSRRKAQVNQGEGTTLKVQPEGLAPVAPLSPTPATAAVAASSPASVSAPAPAPAAPTTVGTDAPASAAPAKPTLQDVEQLDAKSDYRSFVAPDVDPEVRNAAFKKLFHTDPHFNVMDGLDVYIDDYNTPNPLPVAIMKTLVQARAMGLIDDELKEQDPPSAAAAADEEASAVDDTPPPQATNSQETALELDGPTPLQAPEPLRAEPALVELKLVPDQASNDEALSEGPSAGAVVEGSVVPFPRRPGSAGPA